MKAPCMKDVSRVAEQTEFAVRTQETLTVSRISVFAFSRRKRCLLARAQEIIKQQQQNPSNSFNQ